LGGVRSWHEGKEIKAFFTRTKMERPRGRPVDAVEGQKTVRSQRKKVTVTANIFFFRVQRRVKREHLDAREGMGNTRGL